MTYDNVGFEHRDRYAFLNASGSFKEKLIGAHRVLQSHAPYVARIAIALFDPETKVLKTYVHSSGNDDPLTHYQSLFEYAPSLKEILKKGLPRVVNNLVTFENGEHEHTQRIGRQGYAASYTMPIFSRGVFIGFLFFNSYEAGVFDETALDVLDLYGHMISLMVINELTSVQTLIAAVKTTSQLTHLRDAETGSHLDRMSRYSRLIARGLAEKYQLDDDYIEHVFMFAPLHDIGKIAVPDHILLKPGRLTDDEFRTMKLHADTGRDIIDTLLANFGLGGVEHVDILRNIAAFHHEAVNGTGYPAGMSGNDIPLEARIVAVADIFDALTSRRPYKDAWTNDAAFTALQEIAGRKLDSDCVQALLSCRLEVEAIQRQFKESMYG